MENNMTELVVKQHELERVSRDKAQKRFIEKVTKAQQMGREGDTHTAGYFIDRSIDVVFKSLETWVEETASAKKTAGRPSSGARLLPIYAAMTQADRLEFVAGSLGSMFNGITKGVSFTSAAKDIGKRAENILMLREARREDDKLYGKLVKAMSQKSEERKRSDAIRFKAKVEGFEWKSWSEIIKATLGAHMISLIVESIDFFELENVRAKGGKTEKRIIMTDKMRKHYNTQTIKDIMRCSVYEPMVCEPAPWEHGKFTGGGYLTSYQQPLTVAKVSSKAHRKLLREADMPLVAQSLNDAQNTPWRIRKSILEVMQQQVDTKNDLGVIARMTEYEIPVDLPANVMEHAKAVYNLYTHDCHISEWMSTLSQRDAEVVTMWRNNRSKKAAAYKRNMEMQGEWVTTTRTLASAVKLKDYNAIYFPYQLDFRGRVYAATQGGLSPQGADYVKGLLEFAEGKRLGKKGYEWLSFHAANVWGDDKLPVAERKQWVDSRLEWMCDMARDAFTNRDWTKADKPYQFLACCIEFYEANQLDNPHDYESRIPVALDGSCSGLQHLGMASRCLDTAKAVNLVDSLLPSDIYQKVADKAQVWLEQVVTGEYQGIPDEKLEAWTTAAGRWLRWDVAMKDGKLSRKIAKRSVMTYPYGSAEFGFRQQLLDDFLDPEGEKWERADRSYSFEFESFQDRSDAASLMAHLLYRGVKDTVKIPAQLMDWMQKVSALIAKSSEMWFESDSLDIEIGIKTHYSNAGATWTTPLGYPVYQAYTKPLEKVIDSKLYGMRRIQMTVHTTPDSGKRPTLVDKHKQKNGISPNVVHSLDATHLMLTTIALMKQVGVDGKKINAIALIHDSFGTHAANTDIMWDVVRKTMVNMYKRDIFKDLLEQFTAQVHHELRDEIPALPQYGTLDIEELKTSTYAFA